MTTKKFDYSHWHGNNSKIHIGIEELSVLLLFQDAFPDRYVECFIAEQNLVGVAIGCATRGRTVAFVSTFAAFLTRAFDQIRMGAISQTNVTFVGSHAGISIGRWIKEM